MSIQIGSFGIFVLGGSKSILVEYWYGIGALKVLVLESHVGIMALSWSISPVLLLHLD